MESFHLEKRLLWKKKKKNQIMINAVPKLCRPIAMIHYGGSSGCALVTASHVRIAHARETHIEISTWKQKTRELLRGFLMGYNTSAIHRKVLPPTDCWEGCVKRIWSAQGTSICVATSVSARSQGIHWHLQPCLRGWDLHGSLWHPRTGSTAGAC